MGVTELAQQSLHLLNEGDLPPGILTYEQLYDQMIAGMHGVPVWDIKMSRPAIIWQAGENPERLMITGADGNLHPITRERTIEYFAALDDHPECREVVDRMLFTIQSVLNQP
ncbi:hypothetical protein A2Z33_01925 [Candidatus Gottesmanbacteria bacterium RBG_16_52_11]|uniref:Uncharacterized protein n=1 Tax=Candidatus Gottesmanbacteria bacterium RBG_16_52_11 TaxID=1798374 RepID=A0A1F5YR27_9BACT|nr:MAG: hypothetical protein A2Z33_01925 [Candidatus Gottesmanbacteria bacterium RBG_16_52_11]